MSDNEMTFSKAQTVARACYDQFQAFSLLHKMLEKAALAEKTVAVADAKVRAAEERAAALHGQANDAAAKLTSEAEEREHSVKRRYDSVIAEGERRLAEQEEKLGRLVASVTAVGTSLQEAENAAKARQGELAIQEREVLTRIASLQQELDGLRARVDAVIGR